jgi:hypothetical protein
VDRQKGVRQQDRKRKKKKQWGKMEGNAKKNETNIQMDRHLGFNQSKTDLL